MLVRLLYASRAVQDNDAKVLNDIMTRSRAHNLERGVTGILCHGGGMFLQALEGGRMQVNALYNQIVCDPRHRDVVLLHYEEIQERRFASWTMGQVDVAKLNSTLLLKFSEKAQLDPYSVSGAMSLALLEELIATASIVGKAG